MKKEMIKKILDNIDTRTKYTITTNVARGRGINGVEYKTFHNDVARGYHINDFYSINSIFYLEDCIEINEKHDYYDDYNKYKWTENRKYYVPYNNIVMICIDE